MDGRRTASVAVVGGGPAGLMAAEVLATSGAGLHVTVHDRMPSVGRKLQLAGRGGLNLTHTEPRERFVERYGEARERIAPTLDRFGPEALRAWSGGLGQRAVVGTSGRVFPEAFRATPLLRAWLARLGSLGVELRTRQRWLGWDDDGGLRFAEEGRTGASAETTVRADATVLALGGASWPRTGSDGGWVPVLAAAGIDVRPLGPANGGFRIEWSERFRERFAGTPLKNVAVAGIRGEAMVTATGVEGGAVYAAGRSIRRALDAGDPVLHVDLRPDLTVAGLSERLRRRRARDSTSTTLRRTVGLPPVAVALLREDPRPPAPVEELAPRIKDLRLTITGAEPLARAISTSGGIALDEVDGLFMLRRRPGTFVAGEMLDWEAPTGGYLLQACFSTGVAAADGVVEWLAGRA